MSSNTNTSDPEVWVPTHRLVCVGPRDTLTFVPIRTFADQTLRQVIHLHHGAPALRIHVSNRLGDRPLHIDATHAALHLGAGRIDVSTDTSVTFGGNKELDLAPGDIAVSDPIRLLVLEGSEVAISTYLRNPTSTADHHQSALQPGYIADGEAVSAEILDVDAAHETTSLYWICGVDVEKSAHADKPLIAAFGDSLTDGDGSTPGTHNRFVDHLARRLGCTVLNLGISGNRLLRHGYGPAGLVRFERDVLDVPGVTHVLIELGINDLVQAIAYNQPTPRLDDLIEGLRTLARRARAADIVPIAATLTPFRDGGYANSAHEQAERIREQLNTWIRGAEDFDAVLDIDKLMEDPRRAGFLNPAYDAGDRLHPNDAGHRAIAEGFDAAWLEAWRRDG